MDPVSTTGIAQTLTHWQSALADWSNRLGGDGQALLNALGQMTQMNDWLGVVRLVVLFAVLELVRRQLWRLARRGVERIDQSVAASQARFGSVGQALAWLAVIGLHALTLLGAVAVGYALMLVGFVGYEQAQQLAGELLSAFIWVGVARLIIEAFLEPATDSIRLLPLDEAAALNWDRKLMRLATFAGYGLAFVVPVVATVGPALATLIELLVVLVTTVGVFAVMRAVRTPVSAWLRAVAERVHSGLLRSALKLLAIIGYWLVAVYVVMVAMVAILAPGTTLTFVLSASAASVGVFLLGGFVAQWLARAMHAGVVLPVPMQQRLPILQNQLRRWMPRLLKLSHTVLGVVVIAVLIDVWQIADVRAWLGSAAGQTMLSAVIGVLSVGLLALGAWLFAASWIEDQLNPDTGHGEPGAREKTLLALFRNAIAIAIVTIAGMVALSELGIDIGPLIAGAGVIGLAIGFGAQKLVQDIITGVFIQLEDAIHQDDYITAGGISGTVERLSIRSLGLRDLTGTLHVVPFSSVDTVSNYTRDFGYHLGEYGVAYRENIGDVVEHLQVAYTRLCETAPINASVTGPLEVDGVSALADSAVNVRVRIRTTAGMQWAVGRAYNQVVKEVFDEAGIEIPFPHMTLYFGEDKLGNAPPAHIALGKETD